MGIGFDSADSLNSPLALVEESEVLGDELTSDGTYSDDIDVDVGFNSWSILNSPLTEEPEVLDNELASDRT